jgi:hypothetical protein
MSDLLERLAAFWRAHGTSPGSGASEDEIRAFEARHGVRFPSDLRTYFATLNGMANGRDDMDDEMVGFWRLADAATAHEDNPRAGTVEKSQCFVIADFMIGSHFYVAQLSGSAQSVTPILVDTGTELIPLAESFEEFVELYLERDRALYG